MAKLEAHHVSLHADKAVLVEDASLTLQPGELVALIGPNGAGKSSLLRCLVGLEPPYKGTVHLDGLPLSQITPQARALTLAYLPQLRPMAWPISVTDTVALGRYAYGAAPGRLSSEDMAAVKAAMEEVDITLLANRRTDTLSGGEMARVHLARVLAAHTPLLIADEPLAALDPRHQWQVMDLLTAYVARGNGALVVIHDLALAARFADRLVWMDRGRIIADGSPAETMTAARIAEIYGVSATVQAGLPTISGVI